MKNFILFIILGLLSINLLSQNDQALTIAFYNVENLFDTINDPNTKDDDFTPNGQKNWTSERYEKKFLNISKVLSSINPDEIPDLIGLVEIENKTVLEDLINTQALINNKYEIIHEESPDMRGIDVGLIYNPSEFKYLSHKKIPINIKGYKVRDILYTKGIINTSDSLHIFVNHWKSRSGGQEKTEPNRIVCAQTLRNEIDSILQLNCNAKILILGDLNDEPKNKSIFEVLKADNKDSKESLFNLSL